MCERICTLPQKLSCGRRSEARPNSRLSNLRIYRQHRVGCRDLLPIAGARPRIKLEPLLLRVGLTIDQVDDPEQHVDARTQIAFLEAAAHALSAVLGFSLADVLCAGECARWQEVLQN